MAQWLRNSFSIGKCNGFLPLGLLIVFIIAGQASYGQINRYIQQGNSLYEQQKYKEAAGDYAKALAKDPNNVPGMFNFGNSLYQQKQYDSSRKVMEATAKMAKTGTDKASANYNIGNTYMSQQKWDEAINSYKNTLRNNPQDADAKYNLSYAQSMKKKQDQQNKDKDKDKDKKDKDKDKKDQDKKDDKKKDDKGKDPKDKKDEKGQPKPEEQPSKMSQQDAENQLNALQQTERKLQDKLKKEKGTPVRLQKDW